MTSVSKRRELRQFRIRGKDWITAWSREINGEWYDFSITQWADTRTVEFVAYRHNTTTRVVNWSTPRFGRRSR